MDRTRWSRLVIWLSVLSLVVAACGSDSDDSGSDGTDSGSDSESQQQAASSEELETWQKDLNAVGCYAGPVDGQLGPQTEAAIKAFQAAAGLEVDGLIGPATGSALEEAVAAGEIVCTTDGGGGSAGGSTATLSSAGYGPAEFAIGACSSSGETDIELQAELNNMTLLVDASEADRSEAGGAGMLSVDGGTEGDGITLNGTVESVSVGDTGDFTVTGTFDPPNNEGEEFTLTGVCS